MNTEEIDNVFAYGSLIHPGSITLRFLDVEDEVDRIYEEERRIGEDVTINQALEYWDDDEDIERVPAKINGFRRIFSYHSPRGGAMLSAHETGNPEDFINGVVITGLTDEEIEQVSGPEEDYGKHVLDASEFEYYTDKEAEGKVLFYTEGEENFQREHVPINLTYQDRVMIGIKTLAEEYSQQLAQRFFEDYISSTYFIDDSDEIRALTEKEELVRNYQEFLED